MKSFFNIILLITSGTVMRAQTPEYKHQIGIDVTSFVSFYTSIGSDAYGYYYGSPGPFLISYKHYFNNAALRFGFGGNYSNDTETGGPNSNTDYQNLNSNIDIRAGLELETNYRNTGIYTLVVI